MTKPSLTAQLALQTRKKPQLPAAQRNDSGPKHPKNQRRLSRNSFTKRPSRRESERTHLDDGQRRGRNGVGEIAAGGRHGSDDGNGPLPAGGPDAARAAGALVERRQAGTQVGRVPVAPSLFRNYVSRLEGFWVGTVEFISQGGSC